jgi:peptide-methionine (R)-S-oxide reductase
MMVYDSKKNRLSEEQYEVTQNCGTEPPFSGKYYKHTENGIYCCVCCDVKLFDSNKKYDSGSGWPSFTDQIDSGCIKKIEDNSLGLIRIEIQCANCEAHLGHIFPDGPSETGRRYCVNSLSLDFKGNKK